MLDWTQKSATQAEVMVLILGTLCVKHFLGLPSPTLRPRKPLATYTTTCGSARKRAGGGGIASFLSLSPRSGRAIVPPLLGFPQIRAPYYRYLSTGRTTGTTGEGRTSLNLRGLMAIRGPKFPSRKLDPVGKAGSRADLLSCGKTHESRRFPTGNGGVLLRRIEDEDLSVFGNSRRALRPECLDFPKPMV